MEKRVLMGAVACLALSGSGCDDSRRSSANADKPVAEFAPLVNFVRTERWLPMDAGRFLRRSRLWFAHDGGCDDRPVAAGKDLIGPSGPSVHRHAPRDRRCRREAARTVAASARTRPYDIEDRPQGLSAGEGFYLDLEDEARRSDARLVRRGGRVTLTGVDAYAESRPQEVRGKPGLRLTYWFLHGMHVPVGYDARPIPALTHEGAWVHMAVLVQRDGDGYEPVSLSLYSDGADTHVDWSDLEHAGPSGILDRTGSHPVLYSAPGDHVLYPDASDDGWIAALPDGSTIAVEDDTLPCPHCVSWPTWRQLKTLTAQRWYGYGGAWGDIGHSYYTSGPIGPDGKPSAADGK